MQASFPIKWRPDEQKPHTVGGSALWKDTSASIAFRLPAATDSAMFALRCFVDDTLPNAGPISSEMWMRGAWLRLDGQGAGWALYPSYQNASNTYNAQASGTLSTPVSGGAWHSIQLDIKGGSLSASVDGAVLFTGKDVSAWVPATGYVGMGTADYGQFVEFDDLKVQASY